MSAKSEMFEFKIALMLIIFLPYKRVSGIADLDNHDVFANQVEDHLGQPIGMVAEDPRLVRTGQRTPKFGRAPTRSPSCPSLRGSCVLHLLSFIFVEPRFTFAEESRAR